jgi:hypothetical protein
MGNNQTRIENTLPGRESVDIEIFGMEGVPPEDMQAHIDVRLTGFLVPRL